MALLEPSSPCRPNQSLTRQRRETHCWGPDSAPKKSLVRQKKQKKRPGEFWPLQPTPPNNLSKTLAIQIGEELFHLNGRYSKISLWTTEMKLNPGEWECSVHNWERNEKANTRMLNFFMLWELGGIFLPSFVYLFSLISTYSRRELRRLINCPQYHDIENKSINREAQGASGK